MIKEFIAGLLLLVTIIFSHPVPGIAERSQKPLSPLAISVVPVQAGITSAEIKPGDVVEFKVTATSFIDAHDMRIEVQLIGGAKLVSGETSWKGPSAKNEEKTLVLTVEAPEKGKGALKARVSVPPSKTARFSAESQFTLGPETKSKPGENGIIKKDSRGRDIIEYR